MSTTIHIAQATAITTSAALAGANIALSLLVVPSFYHAPAPLMLRQWRDMYKKGKASAPPLGVLCVGLMSYLSYASYTPPLSTNLIEDKWKLFALAAVATGGMIPYTYVVMMPTNSALEAKEEQTRSQVKNAGVQGARDGSARGLLEKWKAMNLVRAFFPLAGAVLGFWGAVA